MPDGRSAYHIDDQTPLCSRREPMDIPRGADICEMREPKRELHAKLDHYGIDPRDSKHWKYVKDSTGGGHRVFDPRCPGEE